MLECDEVWSDVGRKATPVWLWVAFALHARQIVAYVLGNRTEGTAFRLAIARPRFAPMAGSRMPR